MEKGAASMRGIKQLVLISPVALAFACGGSSSGGGSGGTSGSPSGGPVYTGAPVAEAQFQEQAPGLFCQGIETCCGELGRQSNPLICQAFSGLAMPSPDLTYHSDAAGACLQQLRSMQCEASDMPLPCDSVYTGNKQPGEACESDAECVAAAGGDSECDLFDNVCVEVRRGDEGDACNAACRQLGPGGYACSLFENPALPNQEVRCFREDGLSCGAEQVCEALVEMGEPCVNNEDCVDGNYCPFAAMDRICTPKLAVGEACETFAGDCVDSAFCGASGMCEAKKPSGAACMDSDECQGACSNMVCGEAGDLSEGWVGLFCIP